MKYYRFSGKAIQFATIASSGMITEISQWYYCDRVASPTISNWMAMTPLMEALL
jgi:hypothetical protein